MNLKKNITSLATLEGSRRGTYSMLLDLDNELQTSTQGLVASNGSDSSAGFSTIANCLEDLGLNHIKHHYLAGVENHLGRGHTSSSNRCYLREKWFEDALNKTLQWDDTLLPKTSEGGMAADANDKIRHTVDIVTHDAPPSLGSQPEVNFYESVHEALQSLGKSDVTGVLGHILQARKSVLASMEYL